MLLGWLLLTHFINRDTQAREIYYIAQDFKHGALVKIKIQGTQLETSAVDGIHGKVPRDRFLSLCPCRDLGSQESYHLEHTAPDALFPATGPIIRWVPVHGWEH